jgi:hypothetical protein
MRTVTIIGAFENQGAPGRDWNADHVAFVKRLARDLAQWLGEDRQESVGFTLAPSFGGGSGWPVERGFTLTLANVPEGFDVPRVAEWLRARENQEAVCILSREESFTLHTR